MSRARLIGVIGPAECEPFVATLAAEVGRRIAEAGHVLVCGGRGGVMEAACRGAKLAGGLTVGILPSATPAHANPHVDIPIATGMGHARNAVIAHSAAVLIAIGAGYGTLSEIAIALKVGTPVIGLGTWDIPGVHDAKNPDDALEQAGGFLGMQG